MKRTPLILAAVAVLGLAAVWYEAKGSRASPRYRQVRVEKGDLLVTVNATGTVQPVTQVQVGTQVTGTIQKLFADFNSRVTAGQVVAQIDPAPFKALVDQNRANLVRAQADVGRVQAGRVQAEKELGRSRELAKRELISPSDLDAAVATYDSLVAQGKVVEAVVDQSRATLDSSEVNLRYTTIVSPIDGIVVSRNVDVGQTVAASLQAPTLFVVADNLKKIQVQASVAEADIGRIAVDQEAAFTVDAYRDLRFRGRVFQVRLAPTTVQNVVTYTVMINADNPEEKLLPGMTATIAFEIDRRVGVLKVANAALRFRPPEEQAPESSGSSAGDRGEREGEAGGGRPSESRLWIATAAGLRPVPVVPGATDGSSTEIVRGDVHEGEEAVAGLLLEPGDASLRNPFAPRFGGPARGR
ncbi:MAG TPA: efflux RND transporter periplasmic adaptor subunit [Planctomycetota bacterium]|jgi:HlyD family secretion protein|nr:efflux RND transporter periplasmic adaptor subunit [Planctomycetota bacterium]